jgi:hypothetical protein
LINPDTLQTLQRPGVAEDIGKFIVPVIVVLHTGGGSEFTMMFAGSALLFGLVSPGLFTVAVLLIVPLVAMTFIGTVISGKYARAPIAAVTVHVRLPDTTLQFHGLADIFPFCMTPAGNISRTVVCHQTAAGHSFLTRII